MRNAAILFAAAGLAACAGRGDWQPVSLTAPASGPMTAITECVRDELEERGYEITTTDPRATEIVAIRRNEPRWYQTPMGFRPTVDQINVSIEQGQLRVTAMSSGVDDEAEEEGQLASSAARQTAERLVEECGT